MLAVHTEHGWNVSCPVAKSEGLVVLGSPALETYESR